MKLHIMGKAHFSCTTLQKDTERVENLHPPIFQWSAACIYLKTPQATMFNLHELFHSLNALQDQTKGHYEDGDTICKSRSILLNSRWNMIEQSKQFILLTEWDLSDTNTVISDAGSY